jgi:hypothetical protein
VCLPTALYEAVAGRRRSGGHGASPTSSASSTSFRVLGLPTVALLAEKIDDRSRDAVETPAFLPV